MESVSPLPEGTVTFLFTDIEKSTQSWVQQTDAMARAIRRHNLVLKRVIEAHDGVVFKIIGDAFCAVFADAGDAVAAAVEAQRALRREVRELRVRMALHTGKPEKWGEEYLGLDLSRVARLVMAGHGGQMLLTQATVARLQETLSDDAHLRLLGKYRLRDLPLSEEIYQLQAHGLPSEFPELNTLDVAFRRGLIRAAAISAVVLTVVLGLLAYSIVQARRANQATLRAVTTLALGQAKQGVEQLADGNGLGLLDLVEARRTAEPIPKLREATAALWAGWHQAYADRLIGAVGHDGSIMDMTFSPDGKYLATASQDNTVKVWNAHTWDLAAPPLKNEHGRIANIVAFSPDSRLLACGWWDGTVQLCDALTGEPRGRPLAHEGWVTSMAFSLDGKLLATGSPDGTVRLWDTKTGRPHGRPFRPDGDSVPRGLWHVLVGFAPTSAGTLVSVTPLSISLWNPASGERVGQLLRRGRASSTAPIMASSRDGAVWAIASEQRLWIWNPGTRRFRDDLIHNPGTISVLALSRDMRLLATAGPDRGLVQMWATSTGTPSGSPVPQPAPVSAMAFGPVGSGWLMTLSLDSVVHFWDTSTGRRYVDAPPIPGGVTRVALSPDGGALATAGANGTIYVWSEGISKPWRRLPLPSGLLGIAAIEGDTRFAAYSDDGLRLCSTKTRQVHRPAAHVPGQGPERVSPLFSQDGRFLVLRGNRSITVWHTQTGLPLGEPLQLPQPIHDAAVSRHGSVLATCSGADTVEIWGAMRKEPRGAPLPHRSPGGILKFSPDERLLATAEGSDVYLWDTSTGQLRVSIRVGGETEWVEFSPDSRLVAVALQNGSALRLWSTASGQAYLRPLEHPAPVHRGGAFSPDGRLLATVTDENTVRLWDMASGQRVGQPMQHPDLVQAVRFSEDGKRLATAALSGARLWDVATCQLISHPHLSSVLVEALLFGRNESVVALTGDETKREVSLWQFPTTSVGLPVIERLTAVALGVRAIPGGSSEALSWLEWRRLRNAQRSARGTGMGALSGAHPSAGPLPLGRRQRPDSSFNLFRTGNATDHLSGR
jgi:WD40 repeat protein/class 3 adenylate cyclase